VGFARGQQATTAYDGTTGNPVWSAFTQQIAATALSPPDFSQHVYVLGYQYDLGGRRTALTLPSQLGGGQVTPPTIPAPANSPR
jgi:hypothetical protein